MNLCVVKQEPQISISSSEEIIEEARNGRMFILVDDEDRENEGDLIVPAQMATPEIINFMAKEGRGLICLAMDAHLIDRLNLPLMGQQQARMQTAFTVSIEAREGVTTGISAADRARTVQVAIAEGARSDDIVTPGHVFPLRAREGGVLVRAGHTEAAVDVSRLAGLRPAGVICEIMKDDGTMARLPDLVPFAKSHGLKIGTIADLIAYRRKTEKIVERIASSDLISRFGGEFKLHVFANRIAYAEHIALVKGDITGPEPVLVRVHVQNIVQDVLGRAEPLVETAMKLIEKEGRGVFVLIREPEPQAVSGEILSGKASVPEYGIGSQILSDLGIKNMIVLTNHPKTVTGLDAYGLHIVGHRALDGSF
jgi:3,4-dihydroxy 2-butanone 4-phosphate synthase/GTP cyclohydrolase II